MSQYLLDFLLGIIFVENIVWYTKLNRPVGVVFYFCVTAFYIGLRLMHGLDAE